MSQKERYWPQIRPILDNYSNLVNQLTWPDHALAFQSIYTLATGLVLLFEKAGFEAQLEIGIG